MGSIRVGLVVLLVGVAFVVTGIYLAYRELAFLDRPFEVGATVIDLHWEEEIDSGPEGGGRVVRLGFPVFRFTDPISGKEVEALGSVGTRHPPYSVGEEVDVLYDPEDPGSRVVVKSFWHLWLPPLLLCLIGSVGVSIGLLGIRSARAQTGLLPLTS